MSRFRRGLPLLSAGATPRVPGQPFGHPARSTHTGGAVADLRVPGPGPSRGNRRWGCPDDMITHAIVLYHKLTKLNQTINMNVATIVRNVKCSCGLRRESKDRADNTGNKSCLRAPVARRSEAALLNSQIRGRGASPLWDTARPGALMPRERRRQARGKRRWDAFPDAEGESS